MTDDFKMFYATVDVPIYPLISNIAWPEITIHAAETRRFDHTILNDDMLAFLEEFNLTTSNVLLWTWSMPSVGYDNGYSIHSDGPYTDPNCRYIALNWVVSGASYVDWFSYDGAVPKLLSHNANDALKTTQWQYPVTPETHLARWHGAQPAIVNIKQPHRAVVADRYTMRRSISIRFKQNLTMEEMTARLGSRVLKINEE